MSLSLKQINFLFENKNTPQPPLIISEFKICGENKGFTQIFLFFCHITQKHNQASCCKFKCSLFLSLNIKLTCACNFLSWCIMYVYISLSFIHYNTRSFTSCLANNNQSYFFKKTNFLVLNEHKRGSKQINKFSHLTTIKCFGVRYNESDLSDSLIFHTNKIFTYISKHRNTLTNF